MNIDLEILKLLDKDPMSQEKLASELNIDVSISLNNLQSDGYIDFSRKLMKYSIKPAGRFYLKQNLLLDKQNSFVERRLPIIISVFALVIASIGAGYQYLDLQNSPQLQPDLHLYDPRFNTPKLAMFRIANFADSGLSGETLELCIKNSGQTPSGLIEAKLINNWSTNSVWQFQSTKLGDNVSCDSQQILAESCSKVVPLKPNQTYASCDTSQIPEGLVELYFKINCKNCQNREFIKQIKVCIYNSYNLTICDM